MPKNVYYHKHLMFNVGIILSKGEIICIPDSDAMVKETFIETIIKEFEKNPNIVLHIDEIRNEDKKFYPFNYPSFEEVLGKGRVLRWDGKTDIDKLKDPFHLLNYGACMCAKRDHLIKIGGADEHIDYLGHICGVYEMTFRLKNYGLKEVWSKKEFLYHTWHPGEGGTFDYMGPNDGLNRSTTAFHTLITKRIFPLRENKEIKLLREYEDSDINYVLKISIPNKKDFFDYTLENMKKKKFKLPFSKNLKLQFIIIKNIFNKENRRIFKNILQENLFPFYLKLKNKKGKIYITKLLRLILKTLGDLYWKIYIIQKRKVIAKIESLNLLILNHIKPNKIKVIAILGFNEFTKFFLFFALKKGINSIIIYEDEKKERKNKKILNFSILETKEVKNYKGKIIIITKSDTIQEKEKKYKFLKNLGIKEENILIV